MKELREMGNGNKGMSEMTKLINVRARIKKRKRGWEEKEKKR